MEITIREEVKKYLEGLYDQAFNEGLEEAAKICEPDMAVAYSSWLNGILLYAREGGKNDYVHV